LILFESKAKAATSIKNTKQKEASKMDNKTKLIVRQLSKKTDNAVVESSEEPKQVWFNKVTPYELSTWLTPSQYAQLNGIKVDPKIQESFLPLSIEDDRYCLKKFCADYVGYSLGVNLSLPKDIFLEDLGLCLWNHLNNPEVITGFLNWLRTNGSMFSTTERFSSMNKKDSFFFRFPEIKKSLDEKFDIKVSK